MRDNHRMTNGFCSLGDEPKLTQLPDKPICAAAGLAIERRVGAYAWDPQEFRQSRSRRVEGAIDLGKKQLRGGSISAASVVGHGPSVYDERCLFSGNALSRSGFGNSRKPVAQMQPSEPRRRQTQAQES
jgi:hypothetical protein